MTIDFIKCIPKLQIRNLFTKGEFITDSLTRIKIKEPMGGKNVWN